MKPILLQHLTLFEKHVEIRIELDNFFKIVAKLLKNSRNPKHLLFIPKKIIPLPDHELDLNCDQSIESKRCLSRCPGCPVVPLVFPVGQHTTCLWFIKCPAPPHPAVLHLYMHGEVSVFGTQRALWVFVISYFSFRWCVSTVQCRGSWNRGQWGGLDIAALLNVSEHEVVGAGRRFSKRLLAKCLSALIFSLLV